jgi:hypothetical protein
MCKKMDVRRLWEFGICLGANVEEEEMATYLPSNTATMMMVIVCLQWVYMGLPSAISRQF